MRLRRAAVSALAVGLVLVQCGAGQTIDLGSLGPAAAARKEHVVLLTESAAVHERMPVDLELRFRVDPGFHINSHQPKDETLIPTVLKLEGVAVVAERYPAGTPFRLELAGGPAEMLDVYQGEFRVTAKVTVPHGARELVGSLRYQACDRAACFPARTLPVRVVLSAQ